MTVITLESLTKVVKSGELTDELTRDYLSFLLSIPTRMHNTLEHATPNIFTAESLRCTIEAAACQWAELNPNFLHISCDLLFHQSTFENKQLLHWMIRCSKTDPMRVKRLLVAMSNRARFNCLHHFLHALPKVAYNDVLRPLLPLLPELSAQVVRLATGRIVGPNVVYALGRVIGHSGMDVWITLLKYWANSTVIKTVSIEQRSQVAVIICTALQHIKMQTDHDEWSTLYSIVSKGTGCCTFISKYLYLI